MFYYVKTLVGIVDRNVTQDIEGIATYASFYRMPSFLCCLITHLLLLPQILMQISSVDLL
jgi:hypothetical protein